MFELLMRHGVESQQARSTSISQLRNWEVDDVETILEKVKRLSPEYCLFKSDEVKPSKPPPTDPEDPWQPIYKIWPTLWATKPIPISPLRAMVEQSARDGTALCVNVDGEWSLRSEGYCALSHVWIEGLHRDEKIGGLEKTKITKVFELLKRAGLSSEWIWTDVLVIPGGWPTQSLADEMLTVALINSMPQVYGRAEAVLIVDATVLQLHSTDPVEVAVALACGKWATRVWTYQEIKMADRAVVVTATGGIEFADMISRLKSLTISDKPRYNQLYLWTAIMAKSDLHRLTIRDLIAACAQRKSGMDIDYARAFFPVLGLKWTSGMTREQGMQMIYRHVPNNSVAIAAFAGSPRMKLNPGWAPSYLTNLEGIGSEHLKWEQRGIRGEWHILKIKKVLGTTGPRYGKIGLNLEVESNITPTLQCICGPNEEIEVIEAVKAMIDAGRGYILSVNTFATFSKEWARPVLIVEKADTELYHGMEVVAHCAAVIGSPGEHREEKVSLLIRHGNPNVDQDLPNRMRYFYEQGFVKKKRTNLRTCLKRKANLRYMSQSVMAIFPRSRKSLERVSQLKLTMHEARLHSTLPPREGGLKYSISWLRKLPISKSLATMPPRTLHLFSRQGVENLHPLMSSWIMEQTLKASTMATTPLSCLLHMNATPRPSKHFSREAQIPTAETKETSVDHQCSLLVAETISESRR